MIIAIIPPSQPLNYKTHINNVHLNIRKHKCNICNFTASKGYILKKHISKLHSKKPKNPKSISSSSEGNDTSNNSTTGVKDHLKAVPNVPADKQFSIVDMHIEDVTITEATPESLGRAKATVEPILKTEELFNTSIAQPEENHTQSSSLQSDEHTKLESSITFTSTFKLDCDEVECKLCAKYALRDVWKEHLRQEHCLDQEEYDDMFSIEFNPE